VHTWSAEDDLAIRNLIARMAHLADMCPDDQLDDYLALFADDAIWEMPGDRRTGHKEILAGVHERRGAKIQGPGTNTRHVVSSISIRPDGPDRAVSDAYFRFYTGTASDAPKVSRIGHYHDRFVRSNGVWKYAHRTINPG
jgi:uncharacterized protein (TIGR02246 family)